MVNARRNIEGHIYEMAFDGTDAHAEIIERTAGLSFLGDAATEYEESRQCHMTGKEAKKSLIGKIILN